ncbi:MAG: hypothetical protein GY756_03565 [bacterium]|nr:hypothetical protein [bacterium]
MKRTIKLGLIFCFFIFSISSLYSQDYYTEAVSPLSSHGEDLDLTAVLEVFKDSRNLREFEERLNENNGVNNLDLNYDGHIDYIRVLEQVKGNYRVIVLQAIVNENESQDVAVLNVERRSNREIYVQCEGNVDIYGHNYYVQPPRHTHNYAYVHVHSWPIWSTMYAPTYSVYHSPWRWRHYPTYWTHRRPVAYHSYCDRPIIRTCRDHHYVYTHKRYVRRPYNFYKPHSTHVVKHNHSHRGTYNRTAYRGKTYRKNAHRTNYNSYNSNNRSNTYRNTSRNNSYNSNRSTTTRNNSNRTYNNKNTNRNNSNNSNRSSTTRNNSNRTNNNKSTYRNSSNNSNRSSTSRNNSNRSSNNKSTYKNNSSNNKRSSSTRNNSNSTNSRNKSTKNSNTRKSSSRSSSNKSGRR